MRNGEQETERCIVSRLRKFSLLFFSSFFLSIFIYLFIPPYRYSRYIIRYSSLLFVSILLLSLYLFLFLFDFISVRFFVPPPLFPRIFVIPYPLVCIFVARPRPLPLKKIREKKNASLFIALTDRTFAKSSRYHVKFLSPRSFNAHPRREFPRRSSSDFLFIYLIFLLYFQYPSLPPRTLLHRTSREMHARSYHEFTTTHSSQYRIIMGGEGKKESIHAIYPRESQP